MKVEDKSLKIKSLWCKEAYDASLMECCAFCRGTDVWHGIELSVGNMVSGYPFEVEGVRFHNSESAYIAAAFSLGTDEHLAIQRELVDCRNGFLAKKSIRRPKPTSCAVIGRSSTWLGCSMWFGVSVLVTVILLVS